MKKLIAMMALVSMFAVGCAHNRENQGGTSEGNYSTSDTSTDEKGKMQDNNANQPSSSTTSTNSSTTQPPQQ
jgi:major membrane immunogen (membrane-anchored lipoprotein)